ncbi:IPP transferase-domain-containing protein [Poronia punctata]|nr:IPP transferase-domain-containing protein [Poronia punctata]
MASSLLKAPKEPLVVVIGTTGTGKSDLAVDLALKFNGEVVNADAMQMYRGLPVITNQISSEEQRGVPHHLLGQIDPLEPAWVNGIFLREARRVIREIRSRGKLPIVVGGTHYYVHTLLFEEGVINPGSDSSTADAPVEDEHHFRTRQEQLSQFPILNEPTDVVLRKLWELDPAMAERWHPGDRRRILRSLEIYLTTGKRASEIYAEQQEAKKQTKVSQDAKSPWETLIFWVHTSPDALKERLERRVDKMVERGLMDEVGILHRRLRECTERGEVTDRTRGIWQSIGFRQMEPFLDGKLNKESPEILAKKRDTGLEEINIATRQYARYQLRWIRQKSLKSFKEHDAMDHLYVLDSTNADEFSGGVLEPAADICRRYLAGEARPLPSEVSDAASEILGAIVDDDNSAPRTFKIKPCEICDMSILIEDWNKHIKGKRHRRMVKTRKLTAIVDVRTLPPKSTALEKVDPEELSA